MGTFYRMKREGEHERKILLADGVHDVQPRKAGGGTSLAAAELHVLFSVAALYPQDAIKQHVAGIAVQGFCAGD